ncbi:MAG TPA: transcriptional regulator [Chthonomonadaceae bacterium]|nr:transcriptional regulator [Chthonomonadaceae bacterium]
MEVRPIRTEEDHRAALEEIECLWNAPPGSPAEDRLDVLVTLVDAYEAQHHPILPPDPIEAVRYYMESRGITRRDLEESIGYQGRVAEVLNRKRPLTLNMIRRLHARLGLPADVLIQPYPLNKHAAT